MIPREIIDAAKAVASSEGIEAAGLLAFMQVESIGKPYELADLDLSDGREPVMLFERHRFYVNVPRARRDEAVRAGLAVVKWGGPGSAQYADQKTSEGRLALLAKAKAFDAEAAWDSTSMGLLQVLGSNAEACGYPNAVAMHEAFCRDGIAAQIRAGVTFMRSEGLLPHLAAHDWKALAKGYNGKGYARNGYDKKLASAYATWSTALKVEIIPAAKTDHDTTLKLGAKGPRVRALQEALNCMGIVVKVDGDYGPGLRRAVSGAQVELGLTGTGIADPDTVAAIEAAPPIAKGAREIATSDDLRAEGNGTVKIADTVKAAGGAGLGVLSVGSALSKASEYADQARDVAGSVQTARETVTGIVGESFVDSMLSSVAIWAAAHWTILAAAGVCATACVAGHAIVHQVVRSYRAGRTV